MLLSRITEQVELEGMHQDHRVQLLAPHRTPLESHRGPQSVVQIQPPCTERLA